jgi:hypothetical protein
MQRVCGTRKIKNAKHIQRVAPEIIPFDEPLEGFESLVSYELLNVIHVIGPEEVKEKRLSKALARHRAPTPGTKAIGPLFNGTLHFVRVAFGVGKRMLAVPYADMKTAIEFAATADVPIVKYASQYGPTSSSVSATPVEFAVTLGSGKYNDQMLSEWVDSVVNQNGLSGSVCPVFLNPLGVVNTDGDAGKGVLGYHGVSPAGTPYVFVNVMGGSLTVQDSDDVYALALSHEIAEMTVDPAAGGGNPEVCDGCGPNCQAVLRDYFDDRGDYVATSTAFPPSFPFGFYINAIVRPSAANQCPAPVAACSYAP